MSGHSTPLAVLSLCPVSSLPFLIEDETIPGLRDGFSFDSEVKPGWISYDPNQVTLLSCNEMFQPIYSLPAICNTEEQTLSIKTKQDLDELLEMFKKPIFMCVTRRQEDEAMITGFDMDFVISFDPGRDPRTAHELWKITDFVEQKMQRRQKFYLKVDLARKLDEISPLKLKNDVMWLNSAFFITNYCKPNTVMYLDIPCLWFLMFPCCIFISLPYRLWRRIRSEDKTSEPHVRFSLKSNSSVPLVIHFFHAVTERPQPGRYSKCRKLHGYSACPATELKSLLHLVNCWTALRHMPDFNHRKAIEKFNSGQKIGSVKFPFSETS